MAELEKDLFAEASCDKLKSLGIEAVIFDFDDTLIYTSEIFVEAMDLYVEKISAITQLDPIQMKKRLWELNKEEHKKNGVCPHRWSSVIDDLSQEIGFSEICHDHLPILMGIYTKEPRLRPGALSLLQSLNNSRFKVGMVTHANVEWTIRKLRQTGLDRYIHTVEIADEFGEKTTANWQKCLDALGVQGHQSLFVGDNLQGDIAPSVALGAKAFWIPSPWEVYRKGVVPEGVSQINELSDFWDAVDQLS